ERVPRQTRHENGVTGIGAVTVAVEDVATVRRWFAGATGDPGEVVLRDDAGGAGVRFTAGPHRFHLVAPPSATSPLPQRLRRRGRAPRPPRGPATGGRPGPLPRARTRDARLSLE